ncbi:MAG: ferritin family protein [Dehalococcoidales bacterium]|nr:ferritin family protein [Dehalococcoidales bacterium]
MNEDIETAVAFLTQAMEIEQKGRRFYLNAAQKTEDEKGRDIFTTLANDEIKHYQLVKKERDSLTEQGKWVASPEIKPVEIDLDKPLFPGGKKALEKTVTTKSSDWDALLFGLDIEIRSYDMYRQTAAKTQDPLGKQTLQFLAGQEQSHFNLLMMRYESLFGYGAGPS